MTSKYYHGVNINDVNDDVLVDEAVSLALATPAEIATRDDDDQAWAGTVAAEAARRGLSSRVDEVVADIRESDFLDGARYAFHP